MAARALSDVGQTANLNTKLDMSNSHKYVVLYFNVKLKELQSCTVKVSHSMNIQNMDQNCRNLYIL